MYIFSVSWTYWNQCYQSVHGTLYHSNKYILVVEGKIAGKLFKRSLSPSPYWQPELLDHSWFSMQYIAFLDIHLLLISGLFWKITSFILEPASIFFSVVLWYSQLESLESNLNSWLYFICAAFSSFPDSTLSCPVFCLNILFNEEKNPNSSLLRWPLK